MAGFSSRAQQTASFCNLVLAALFQLLRFTGAVLGSRNHDDLAKFRSHLAKSFVVLRRSREETTNLIT